MTTKQPRLKKEHKLIGKEWATKQMKVNWDNVIFTDECRVDLDGPDGFKHGWIRDGWPVKEWKRRHQAGGSVML